MPKQRKKRTVFKELETNVLSSSSNSIMEFEEEANRVIDNYTDYLTNKETESRIDYCYNDKEKETDSEVVDDPEPINKEADYPANQSIDNLGNSNKCVRWDVLKKVAYPLICEWKDCNFSAEHINRFMDHVGDHIPNLELKPCQTDDDEVIVVYVCQWKECEAEIITSDEAIRHVYFHAVHTKLKSIGDRLMNDENHPKCLLDNSEKNLLPELPEALACKWEDCSRVFHNAQKFYYHVQAHAASHLSNTKNGNKSVVQCLWRGCRATCRGLQKMNVHLYTHTKEKTVGCPTCGGLFANTTKFFDHCSRQTPRRMNAFQCSHCARSYSTVRLLRDHMRNHINSYKCPFCDMTSPTPSSLSLHIRNRHFSDKPFKCNFCSYKTQTKHNLDIHMKVHYSNARHFCPTKDCEFSCRTTTTLQKHLKKAHGDGIANLYCCHLCTVRKSKGALLSKHLIDNHNFRLPSGHSRFRYKSDSSGLYHLETVRYECLETTQEMQEQAMQTVLYLTRGGASGQPVTAPVFINYETLDSEGKVVSQLVGGKTYNVPLVKTISTAPVIETLPMVILPVDQQGISTVGSEIPYTVQNGAMTIAISNTEIHNTSSTLAYTLSGISNTTIQCSSTDIPNISCTNNLLPVNDVPIIPSNADMPCIASLLSDCETQNSNSEFPTS